MSAKYKPIIFDKTSNLICSVCSLNMLISSVILSKSLKEIDSYVSQISRLLAHTLFLGGWGLEDSEWAASMKNHFFVVSF